MEEVFLRLANYSLVASYVVLAILVVRLFIKKAPKWLICLMWSLVAIRLIFPFSVESTLSLIPSAEPLPQNMIYSENLTMNVGIPVVDYSINPVVSETLEPAPLASANPTQIFAHIASRIWIIGVIVMIVYALGSAFLLMRRLSTATLLQKGVKQSERIDSPFVFGIIRPIIYLPYKISENDFTYVLAHERAHIRRKDHLWKPLGFLLLSVYWFNPVLWIAYIFLCRDIEAACDEKVIKDMELDERKAYSMALLHCSVHHRMMITACPIAFGENSVKTRIKDVMNYKKPAFWIVIISVVALIVGVVCFLTNPKSTELPNDALGMSLPYYAIKNTLEDGEYLFAKIPDSFISDKNIPGSEVYHDWENRGSLSEVTDLFGKTALDYTVVECGLPFHFLFYKNGNPALLATGDIYSVDVDGDGIPELINNAIWADGGQLTKIYKRTEDGGILYGYADNLLDEEYDSVGVGSQYSYYLPEENKVDIFFWKENKQAYDEKKYTIDLSKIEMFPYEPKTDFSDINKMPDLGKIVSRIAGNRDVADVSYKWSNTVDFKPDASVLIQMAVDPTKRYEIYGVMSPELGTCGMLLNDRINGEANCNYVYEFWLYTGSPADEPTLSYEDEQLVFTYVYGQDENGKSLTRSYIVDCGYNTGHMEFK